MAKDKKRKGRPPKSIRDAAKAATASAAALGFDDNEAASQPSQPSSWTSNKIPTLPPPDNFGYLGPFVHALVQCLQVGRVAAGRT